MTRPTGILSLVAQQLMLCMLAAVLFLESGCVSRRTYEKITAETLEQTRALESVREDVRELDREIIEWQASNRREDAVTSELRAAIQREEEQWPIMRQRAEDSIASLKTQVATLMNQSWHLARRIVDIRQESAALRAKVAQYREEIEQVQSSIPTALISDNPSTTQSAVIEAPPPVPANATEASAQITQPTPTPPSLPSAKPAAPSPSVNVDSPSADDSWIGMITGWFIKIWNWLFG